MEPASNNKLVLKIIFVVLFLVLLGELGYVFMTANKKNSTNLISPTSTPTIAPTKASAPVSTSISVSPSAEKPHITPVPEYQGKITEINVLKITPTPGADNIEFSFVLETGNIDIKKLQTFFFKKSELEVMKVIDSTGKTISYKDLKVGQNIKFFQKYGPKENPYSSFEIDVLN